MSRFVVFKLMGDLERGFHVSLDIAQEGQYPALSEEGELPPNPELAQQLAQWQDRYQELTQPSRILNPYKIQYDGSIDPLENCIESAETLAEIFKQWLRSDSFRDLEKHLCRVLSTDDTIRVLIRSTNQHLHALPWHLWSFIEEYPHAEIAMGAPRFQRTMEESTWTLSKTPKVTILAILGDRQNIDIDTDRQLLNQLPGAKVTLLVEPTPQEFHDQLYEKPWDILFFAGHSDTLPIGQSGPSGPSGRSGQSGPSGQGILKLNPETFLTIEELKYGVKKAIANGLQLAIFNSCNGVGLAHALAELQLPQMIVMRQAIPDHVAHTFLKYFLETFSKGTSFYRSAREARERLQSMEQDFPCASWLPMIYQHPAKMPPSWRSLRTTFNPTPLSEAPNLSTLSPTQKLTRLALVSFAVTSVVMGIRFLGGWQPLEFWAFNSLMQWKASEPPDDRLLLITVNESDIAYQKARGDRVTDSLSNKALADLLIRLRAYNPAVVGLDIFRDEPLAPDVVVDKRFHNFFFVCNRAFLNLPGSATVPPPDVPPEQVGFSNMVLDSDYYIRRQLVGMTSTQTCPTQMSFSYHLARQYLWQQHNISDQRINGMLRIGNITFPQLSQHQGPYHLDAERFQGYSFLLNFRKVQPAIAPTIPLKTILNWDIQPEELEALVRDRIILIGSIAPSLQDYHLTPYGKMAGVAIHAQMVSQIISAVLDDRPLLSVWPQWGDGLWLFAWTLGAGGLAIVLHRRYSLMVAATGLLSGLSGGCLWALHLGLWLPLMPTAIACTATMAILQHQKLIPLPWLNQNR